MTNAFREPRPGLACAAGVALACALAPAPAASSFNPDGVYPGPEPGAARIECAGGRITAANDAIVLSWSREGGGLRPCPARDVADATTLPLEGELFQVAFEGGARHAASGLVADGAVRLCELAPEPGAARLSARVRGRRVEVPLRSADGALRLLWSAELRDGAAHVRQEIAVTSTDATRSVEEILWADCTLPGATTAGTVDGSPVVCGHFFLGCEDPHARNETGAGRVSCRLPRRAVLGPGETLASGFVIGVVPEGQVRRGFLHYLERERAHPHRPFLHYNSWYDISWPGTTMDEAACLEAIRAVGERLVRRHGVVVDAMVFDDGWDDPASLWRFHAGFPRGFVPLAGLARGYGMRLGTWLSPFGGYGEAKKRRLEFGRGRGYETNARGFSPAGPRYYGEFRRACIDMIRRQGVVHFKFDGVATGSGASGGGDYVRDTEAMRRLMQELRGEEPALHINLTTGSWPSPFWLFHADSIWRQGADMGEAGAGPKQQRWLTYRDQETRRNIVSRGPLFPLNALMTQGVAYSRRGRAGEPTFDSNGFRDDVRAFFGSGTGLQELYIQPDRLSDADWATLAEAARWARARAATLVDTHWIGGDPGRGEVYGFASWSPAQGIVTLRNPADRPARFALDIAAAFELPPGAPRRYALRRPWTEDATRAPVMAEAGFETPVALEPFEVAVFDAQPVTGSVP